MILTLIPIRPFYQTSAGVRSVGNGRLRMRRPASLSTVSLQAIYGTRYTETRAAWGSVGDGRLRMRPPAGYDQLILRWDVCVVIMKDIIYKCYRYGAGLDTLRFPAGRQ